jgi:hypothetical protein
VIVRALHESTAEKTPIYSTANSLAFVSIITQQEVQMKKSLRNRRRLRILIAVPAVIAIAVAIASLNLNSESNASAAPADKSKTPSVEFNKAGELVKPTGYRKWTYVGTPLTPNDMNGGKAPFPEFHSVYMNPEAYSHYEKTGDFPDGTVLVKELISVGDKEASSGIGYFMGDFAGLEVSIKDKTRFQDEPGNWAYFSFGHKYPLKDMAKKQPSASCNDCHNGDADDDYVFTQYYPVLRAAKDSTNSK